MTSDRTAQIATITVLLTGVIWGFYWMPVRAVSDAGLSGAWSTAAITLAATVLLLPAVLVRRRGLLRGGWSTIAFVAIGGAGFSLYSVGLVYGRVAIIILLFFLTPVWSTLIGRYLIGWHTPRLRVFAIFFGLAGLLVMLGAKGDVPIPRGLGEWMALAAGILWATGTNGMKVKSNMAPIEAAFIFAIGAFASAAIAAAVLEPLPSLAASAGAAVMSIIAGLVWWVLSIAGLMWATMRLDPARVGILLMSEVLIGAVSAALLAEEHLSALEFAGGGLVILAALLEVWPVKRR